MVLEKVMFLRKKNFKCAICSFFSSAHFHDHHQYLLLSYQHPHRNLLSNFLRVNLKKDHAYII
jgi:hypothetical protein